MSQQKQDVGDNSPAIQAGGHVTINNIYNYGMSEIDSQNMKELIENRLKEFEATMDEKMAANNEKIDPEILNDPDFQYSIRQAKISYSRKGGENLRNRLSNLIVSRSKQKSNTRLANVVNDAIEISHKLNAQEIDTLVILFLLGHVTLKGLSTEQLIASLNTALGNHASQIPEDSSCIEYLKGERCVQQRPMGTEFWNVFMSGFSGSLSHGFSMSEYNDALNGFIPSGPTNHPPIRIPEASENTKLRFVVESKAALESSIPSNWPDPSRNGVLGLYEAKLIPLEIVKPLVLEGIPALRKIEENWVSSGMAGTMLLPLGMAIARSALEGTDTLDAPIDTWVR